MGSSVELLSRGFKQIIFSILFTGFFSCNLAQTNQKSGLGSSFFLSKSYLMGQFNPETTQGFAKLDPSIQVDPERKMYMREEALQAFLKMRKAALAAHVDLKIASATRNFDTQKSIWEKKWKGIFNSSNIPIPDSIKGVERAKRILEYSSMPGTSRHHWGTDIDINSVENAYFETKKGSSEYQWLSQNAYKYGFCQTYTAKGKNRPRGYNEEPWHWSYLPLAKTCLTKYIEQIDDSQLKGFLGSETAVEIKVVENYVKGINKDCLK